MRLLMLGPLEVHAARRRVELRPVEVRLLAALATRRTSAVSYDVLVDAVWGDGAPRSAVHSLQTHVTRVRRAMGRDGIETVNGGYRLGSTVAVDADEFEAAAAEATRAVTAAVAQRDWDTALALWRGTPLEELDDWAPAVVERIRLLELWLIAREERCAAALEADATPAVVAEARALVEADPLRERRWGILMSALEMSERRAEALRTFDRARRVLAEELGISPGVELVRLHQRLLVAGDDPAVSRSRRTPTPGRLPAPSSTLVGRTELIDSVERRLRAARIVTLVGAGGIGKTRLALAVAERMSEEWSGGVRFVGLATAVRPGDVDELVAGALGTAGQEVRRDDILSGIGDGRVLLLLDNCEHLVDAVAGLVSDVLGRCPGAKVLATSRRPLAVAGEETIVVPPLSIDGSATELFVARALQAHAAFEVDDASALALVSRRLGGVPLAIELAAAHARTLGLGDLAERLAHRVDPIDTTRSGGSAGRRTMADTFDWSFDLLSDVERRVFARLSVFAGRFDLGAVAHVVAGPPVDRDLVDVLAALVDASLVATDSPEPARFRLIEPLRAYAADKLAALGETDALSARHAAYFSSLAEQLRIEMNGPAEIAAMRRVDATRDNFRLAFSTALERADADTALRIVVALGPYAAAHVWVEPWAWSLAVLELPEALDHPLCAAASLHAGEGAWQLGQHQRAVELAESAIALAPPGSEDWLDAHRVKAGALVWLGRLDEAIASASRSASVDVVPPTAASVTRASTLLLLRNLSGDPDPDAGRALLDVARRLGHPATLALAHHTAGMTLARVDPTLAAELQRVAVTLAEQAGARLVEGFALIALAGADPDPIRASRATVEVMDHYLRVGNHAHLRSFACGLTDLLAVCGDAEAAAVVGAATRGEPTLGRYAARARAKAPAPNLDPTGQAVILGAQMSDEELVRWLDDRISGLESARSRQST